MTHRNNRSTWQQVICIMLQILLFPLFILDAQETKIPFYNNITYDISIPSPDEVLGYPLGEKPIRYDEVIHYFKTLSERSPHVIFFENGKTHEGRSLFYVVISSQQHISHLVEIQNDFAKLADPRQLSSRTEANTIIQSSPAVVWLMYNIHGDELSGTDAAAFLAYHLAAGIDSVTEKIRQELIVGIDPIENPDGRERFLSQIQQWTGIVPHSDVQSIQHVSVWPWGRTNHYLFDLNRDWFILAQPESRSRVRTLLQWHPQVVVDSHEMGSYDTYLFNPPREPFNPHLDHRIKKWWKIFAADQAKAFDEYGWSYYTREWLDEWYPGYGSSWPYYIGAVGILYEQATTDGSLVKKPDGTILTFRDAVHHQFISSLTNIKTAANYRLSLLQNFYEMKNDAIAPLSKSDIKAYFILPEPNRSRASRLIKNLLTQGIEVEIAEHDFQMNNLRSYWDTNWITRILTKGTYIIRLNQPQRALIHAILEFDPRMSNTFLQSEQASLEKGEGTRMYEVSAWSMLLAYHVPAFISMNTPNVKTRQMNQIPHSEGIIVNTQAKYGFILDYSDDVAGDALTELLEKDYIVRSAKKSFTIEGKSFPKGSLLIRKNENPITILQDLQKIVHNMPITIYGVNTALSEEGPDLGGNDFHLLIPPKIALIAGPMIDLTSLGALWYLLDYELRIRHSILDYNQFSAVDLRKYNVLILPACWGGLETYHNIFDNKDIQKLKDWISNGGTLIGIETGAAFLADSAIGISSVKLRRQALKELALYEEAVEQEGKIGKKTIDSLNVWESRNISKNDSATSSPVKFDFQKLIELDKRQRLFMPRGAILRVNLDESHWINFGVGEHVPVILNTAYAFLAKRPVRVVGRFSEISNLRLSGLVWPEAKSRWEKTANTTQETFGKGQVILFAADPVFRSYFYGTGRMLINCVLLGPGMGTLPVVPW